MGPQWPRRPIETPTPRRPIHRSTLLAVLQPTNKGPLQGPLVGPYGVVPRRFDYETSLTRVKPNMA